MNKINPADIVLEIPSMGPDVALGLEVAHLFATALHDLVVFATMVVVVKFNLPTALACDLTERLHLCATAWLVPVEHLVVILAVLFAVALLEMNDLLCVVPFHVARTHLGLLGSLPLDALGVRACARPSVAVVVARTHNDFRRAPLTLLVLKRHAFASMLVIDGLSSVSIPEEHPLREAVNGFLRVGSLEAGLTFAFPVLVRALALAQSTLLGIDLVAKRDVANDTVTRGMSVEHATPLLAIPRGPLRAVNLLTKFAIDLPELVCAGFFGLAVVHAACGVDGRLCAIAVPELAIRPMPADGLLGEVGLGHDLIDVVGRERGSECCDGAEHKEDLHCC